MVADPAAGDAAEGLSAEEQEQAAQPAGEATAGAGARPQRPFGAFP